MALTNRLGIKVNTASELASYIINQSPLLSAEVDLPTQGDANYLPKLGELISSDNRYKNAFLNTIFLRLHFDLKAFTQYSNKMAKALMS